MIVGTHWDHIFGFIGSGIAWVSIVVTCMISSSGHKSNASSSSFINGGFHRGWISSSSPWVGGQVYANLRCICDGLDTVWKVSPPRSSQELKPDHRNFPTNSDYSFTIISYRPYCSSTVSPVWIIIVWVVVIIVKVPSVDVIDITVLIIINPVTRNFVRVCPHICT